jgi:hypothetical protein
METQVLNKFRRIHKSLPIARRDGSEITDHVWEFAELVS